MFKKFCAIIFSILSTFTLPVLRISPLKCTCGRLIWLLKFCFLAITFFFVFFVLTKIFVQCNSHFWKTKLDSFYNTFDLCYFHKVSLICSADNIYIYEKSDHKSLHNIVLMVYPEIFKDNACIWNHHCLVTCKVPHAPMVVAEGPNFFEFNISTLLKKALQALPTQIKFQ